MKSDIIYLKLSQNSKVNQRMVRMKDVAEVLSVDKQLQDRAENLILHRFEKGQENRVVASALYVIRQLQKRCPQAQVVNIGEKDIVIEYLGDKKQPGRWWEYFKAAFVGLVLFFGAAFTIMTFNTDVSVGQVFSMFYKLVTGKEQTSGSILEITYNIGIAVGIMGFYNHFSRRRELSDPTPLHVDMRDFEQQMNQTIIVNAAMSQQEKTVD